MMIEDKPKIPFLLKLISIGLSIIIITLGYYYYEDQSEIIQKNEKQDLEAISSYKTSQIDDYLSSLKEDAETVSKNKLIGSYINEWLTNQNNSILKHDIINWLITLQKSINISSIVLIDKNGKSKLHVGNLRHPFDVKNNESFQDAIQNKKVVSSDLYWNRLDSTICLNYFVPIIHSIGNDSLVTSVIVLNVNPNKQLFPILKRWPKKSKSAEAYLIRRKDKSIEFLGVKAHVDSESVRINFDVSTSLEESPAFAENWGEYSTINGIDYKGIPVIAVIRKIPASIWSLVIKENRNEILAPLISRAQHIAVIVILLLLMTGVSVGYVWNQQNSKHFQRLYQSEVEKKALQQHIENFIKYANDIIILMNNNGKILEVNERALTTYGFTKDEFLKLKATDLSPKYNNKITMTLLNEENSRFGLLVETIHKRKDGSEFPVEVSSRAIEIEDAKYFQFIIRNITDRKRANEHIRQQSQIIDQIHDAVISTDIEGKIKTWNKGAEKLYGYSIEEVKGKNISFLYSSSNGNDLFEKYILKPLREKGNHDIEIRLRRPTGDYYYVHLSISYLTDNKGKEIGIIGYSMDITERKMMELKIRESNKKINNILESITDAFFALNDDWNITYINKQAAKLLRKSRVELLGQNLWVTFPEAIGSTFQKQYEKAVQNHIAVQFEEFYPPLNTWFEVHAYPSQDGLSIYFRDITERKKYEKELFIKESAIETSNNAIILMDLNGKLTYANSSFLNLWGFESNKEISGKSAMLIWNDKNGASKIFDTLKINSNWIGEMVAQRKSGATFDVQVSASMVKDKQNQPICMMASFIDITEKKKAEKAFNESERRFKNLLTNIKLLAIEIDTEGRIIFINDYLCNLLGIKKVDAIDKKWNEHFIPFESKSDVDKILHKAVTTGEFPLYYQNEILVKDGQRRLISWNNTVLRNSKNQIVSIAGIGEDITQRKKTEEQLLFQANILNNVRDSIVVIDKTGKVIYWNEGASAIFGYSASEMLGNFPSCLFLNWDENEFKQSLKKLTIKKDFVGEWKGRTKKAKIIWIDVIVTVLSDKNGNAIGFIGVSKDITDKKNAEEKLRESEERYRSLVELSPEMIAVFNKDKFLYINQAGANLLGANSPEEVVNTNIEEIFNSYTDKDEKAQIIELLNDSNNTSLFEFKFSRLDGKVIEVESTSFPIVYEGKPARQAIIRDVTKRNQAEISLKQYNKRLRIQHEIDASILNSESAEDIADAVLEYIRQLLPCIRTSIAIFDFEKRIGNVISIAGEKVEIADKGKTVPLELFGEIDKLRNGEINILKDISELSDKISIADEFKSLGINCYINVPMVSKNELIGTLNLGFSNYSIFTDEYRNIAKELADSLAVAIQETNLFKEIRKANDKLKALSRKLIEIQEFERRAISRELHDEIGQLLTAAKISLQSANKIADSEKIKSYLFDGVEIVEVALKHVRNLSLDLRPSLLDDLGLLPAIRWYIDRYAKRTGLHVNIEAQAFDSKLAPEIEIACYRIIQEALTNIAKHSKAENVDVRIFIEGKLICLIIRDNGVGFDVQKAELEDMSGKSMGLLSMYERVDLVNGKINILSALGEGTIVQVRIPVKFNKTEEEVKNYNG